MGLFDMFRRPSPEPPEHYVDLVRRVGRCEAETENLTLQWQGYRDEIKRLVNRLEKRDQRAQAREEAETPEPEGVDTPPVADPVTERVRARRARGISKFVAG